MATTAGKECMHAGESFSLLTMSTPSCLSHGVSSFTPLGFSSMGTAHSSWKSSRSLLEPTSLMKSVTCSPPAPWLPRYRAASPRSRTTLPPAPACWKSMSPCFHAWNVGKTLTPSSFASASVSSLSSASIMMKVASSHSRAMRLKLLARRRHGSIIASFASASVFHVGGAENASSPISHTSSLYMSIITRLSPASARAASNSSLLATVIVRSSRRCCSLLRRAVAWSVVSAMHTVGRAEALRVLRRMWTGLDSAARRATAIAPGTYRRCSP
mmetsp:Transcript_23277/g.79210  ORF Transcript_23277/g.79210 Transcript_23277/m.79210 type:complete len:271 (-) Transcript_23277:5-817(-)